DNEWKDAGTRRQAFYTSLPPGRFGFHVMACNNDGLWNEEGATLEFSVLPAFYQTRWFLLLCFAAFGSLVWVAYRWRIRHLAVRLDSQFEARLAERTRIARDLHDTLLQSFQGVLLKFSVISYLIPNRPAEAQQSLETAIEQARKAITEGRDAVQGLRSST